MASASITGLNSLNLKGAGSGKVATTRIDTILTDLNSALISSISKKFTARNKPELLSKQVTKQGNTLVGTLTYRQVYSDLSKFPTTYKWGNINPNAKRPGRVHTTTVVRNRARVVYGKSHRGGFMPRSKGGNVLRYGRHGSQMFERKSDSRLPLRLLLGPNTSIMIGWALRNSSKVRSVTRDTTIGLTW